MERIGAVAYRLDLPVDSKVHPVFHVSLLRKVLQPKHQVLPQLPTPDDHLQILEQVLNQRVVRRGSGSLVQVLVKWSATPVDMATWEDKVTLQQKFLRAPAWGKAVSKEGGIVSDPEMGQGPTEEKSRPKRQPRLPARLAGPEWAHVGSVLKPSDSV